MSCAKIDPTLHQAQKPPWIKVRLPSNPVFFSTKALISDLRLHTVCESAQCPNRWECWSQGTATVMIAGERCTRACGFCAVKTGRPTWNDTDEPRVVLMMHVARPQRFPGTIVRNGVMALMRKSPYVKDANAQILRWPGRSLSEPAPDQISATPTE